ncbi:polyprenol dehydrogenase-like [Dermatophagoides pteronyssinus]|uniref:polyprenol dehydrogenase-like n=1 Tax=Dermatophagoides pteronyssinus TaxID=6956 RepID=UPI003F6672B4
MRMIIAKSPSDNQLVKKKKIYFNGNKMTQMTISEPGFKQIWLRKFQIFINKFIFILWTGLLIYAVGPYYSIREFLRNLQIFGFKKLDYSKEFNGIDLSGKVCVITGGTRGIGLEVCRYLVEKNCHIITGTSTLKDDANDEMIEQTKRKLLANIDPLSIDNADNKITVLPLDLSSMNSVIKFAKQIKMKFLKIDYLICNGGVMFVPFNISSDHFEQHMAINYYGHCLLITKLLTLLSMNDQPGRIIIVSSGAHHASFGLRLHDLNSMKLFSTYHSYCQSKLCQIMFTYQFNRWLYSSSSINCPKVTINCLHPGMCRTGLMNAFNFIRYIGFIRESPLFRSAAEGAETILFTTLSKKIETISGEYFEDCQQKKSSQLSYDLSIQKQLWQQTWQDLRPWLTTDEIKQFLIKI